MDEGGCYEGELITSIIEDRSESTSTSVLHKYQGKLEESDDESHEA